MRTSSCSPSIGTPRAVEIASMNAVGSTTSSVIRERTLALHFGAGRHARGRGRRGGAAEVMLLT